MEFNAKKISRFIVFAKLLTGDHVGLQYSLEISRQPPHSNSGTACDMSRF